MPRVRWTDDLALGALTKLRRAETRAPHGCTASGCPALTTGASLYCDEHLYPAQWRYPNPPAVIFRVQSWV